ALVQVPAAPVTTKHDRNPVLSGTSQHFSYTFRANANLTAAVSLQVGGASQPWTFCLDNLSFKSGALLQPYVPATGPRVRVNQAGYFPFGPKGATLVTSATTPLRFRVLDQTDHPLYSGQSIPRGLDPTSGLNV